MRLKSSCTGDGGEKSPKAWSSLGPHANMTFDEFPKLYQLVEDCREQLSELRLSGDVQAVTGYFPISNSELHLDISVPQYAKKVENALEPWVHEWIARHDGSINASHGLGLAKKQFLRYG
jgi:(R)-2-hydroxyglutarate---pyruvate transhydrogenase